ncbi:ClpP/crotonase [Xylona heveae TC161]|uniref:ClpP/crotonase n=1 Tax=Xylona heveae (strain CBS 132557 / TC161) TaxID=1328760 RepID=A0A165ICN1_XYLHT|nr:ClpP/crotonase [Xylona heveae TC161]KZF24709.1 ClpP/crotonase [Xylona heveae TC161]
MVKVTNVDAPYSGSIRILSLNRPKARNALSRELLAQLNSEISAARYDGSKGSLKALIIASDVDNCFCAGADLKERQQFTHDETKVFLSYLRSAFNVLASLPIPTISAIASNAFGGGLELALCTKMRVFGSSARVGLPETRLGIIPGAGGTYRLPMIVGPQHARDLILTGRQVSGPEAYFLGLCDRLVEITPEEAQQEGVARQKVLDEAIKLATVIAEGAPLAIKAALQAVDGWQGAEQNEIECYEKVLTTEDRDEALSAFVMKRKPVFKGK